MEKPNSNRLKHARRGTLSMVCDANGRFGSQFFVTLEENLSSLDGKHAVFGEVAEESYEVLEKMTQAICDEENRPYRDIR
jgi:peptidyl-prolyl cis-trans isomerase-like 4